MQFDEYADKAFDNLQNLYDNPEGFTDAQYCADSMKKYAEKFSSNLKNKYKKTIINLSPDEYKVIN